MAISALPYEMIIWSSALAMKVQASLLGMIRMRAYLILITNKEGMGDGCHRRTWRVDNLRNYIDITMLFSFAFPLKTTK